MEWKSKGAAVRTPAAYRSFRFGPPQDREGIVQLFSLVLHRADGESTLGKRFELPFAVFLRLANQNRPSLQELDQFCDLRQCREGWPALVRMAAERPTDGDQPGMFFDLLRYALDSAKCFDLDGPHLCRVLAAVGQTLQSKNERFRQLNRALAAQHRVAAQQLIAPPIVTHEGELARVRVSLDIPWEVEFQLDSEQGGSVCLEELTLWHASHIGPAIAAKSENQDATFAVRAHEISSRSCLVFALADGVSTSMGARVAAASIVRRFCEFVLREIKPGEAITGWGLMEAARQTQDSLDELARALLDRSSGYVFDAVRGDSLHSKTAIRILDNTLHPRVTTIPAALTATLIGGVVQKVDSDESYRVDLLCIGDGAVEQVGRDGEVSAVVETDPDVMAITEALGPGPRGRELFESSEQRMGTYSITLRSGEALIVSSDGLARGHRQSVSSKLAGLLGEEFWEMAQPEHADFALELLRKASRSADELFQQNPEQLLFADNLSLIMIRCGV